MCCSVRRVQTWTESQLTVRRGNSAKAPGCSDWGSVFWGGVRQPLRDHCSVQDGDSWGQTSSRVQGRGDKPGMQEMQEVLKAQPWAKVGRESSLPR